MADKMTLFDYRNQYPWIKMLNWSDDELRAVPIHGQCTTGEECINLCEVGPSLTMALGQDIGAGARTIPDLYVFKREVPAYLWTLLCAERDTADSTAFEQQAIRFGDSGSVFGEPPPVG